MGESFRATRQANHLKKSHFSVMANRKGRDEWTLNAVRGLQNRGSGSIPTPPGKKDRWPVGSKALPMLEKFVGEWRWWLVENQQKTPAGEAGKIGGTQAA